jgi:uncharacterized protein (DUF2249 family)
MSENVHFEGDAQKRPKKERKRHPRIFSTFNLRKNLRGAEGGVIALGLP